MRNIPILKDHIVVCLFCGKKTPPIGLYNFVLPLRSSAFEYDELKAVVFLGDETYLRKEWPLLKNFPKIYVKPVKLDYSIKQRLKTCLTFVLFLFFLF